MTSVSATTKNLRTSVRRSHGNDASGLTQITQLRPIVPCIPPETLFPWRTPVEFAGLIEQSVLCITATSSVTGRISGFISLDDTPRVASIPGDSWDALLPETAPADVLPSNALWITALLAPPSSAFQVGIPAPGDTYAAEIERKLLIFSYTSEDLIRQLLATALENAPNVRHLLVAIPNGTSYPPLQSFATSVFPVASTDSSLSPAFEGSFLHIDARAITLQLSLRIGIMEDYDDFVPPFLSGRGLITALPEEFYLEELLKDQDSMHKVIIAEDPNSHKVVGLMCLEASIEGQQLATRQYATEVFGKLRPIRPHGITTKNNSSVASSETPNVVKITFFQIDPDYALLAEQFMPFVFEVFSYVEYAMIILPYTIDETPFLRHFDSVPLRKYQPRNAKGESIPPPDGMWITCRYAIDPVAAVPIETKSDVDGISKFLEEPLFEFSHHHVAALIEDMATSENKYKSRQEQNSDKVQEGTSIDSSGSNVVVLALLSLHEEPGVEEASTIIGVASARRLTLNEMYALRANYDLDTFVNYYARAPRDYSVTDIRLTPEEGQRKFFRNEMPGLLIRSFYVKAMYRRHIPFLVRELLRRTGCEVALSLEDSHAVPFTPLLRQLVATQPRRVQERAITEKTQKGLKDDNDDDGGGGGDKDDEIAPLGCLFAGSRRILGDRKRLVHTRLVFVGASSTGLACIHRLLSVPYVCFTNILLISTDGMPSHPNQQQVLWAADRFELMEREHMRLTVGNPIRVVHGAVVDVDTTQHYVSIDDGTYEPYDYVILTTGRQYVVPPAICALHNPTGGAPSRGTVPNGTLALNGDAAVERLRQHLYDIDANPQNISNVVVYGSGLDAFAAATSIAKLGFSPQRLVVVSPEASNPFVDNDVFDCVVKMWNSLGTNTLRGYRITRMEYDDDTNTLTTVVVSPVPNGVGEVVGSPVELNCSLIVCCEDKDIDTHILFTLNRRSIVFDGRVIVEVNYQTTNHLVYAAGPVAMFTRRYGTTPNFDEFNAADVGSDLAKVLLDVLGFDEFADPTHHVAATHGDDELIAAHDQLYQKVLEENGSRNAALAAGLTKASNSELSHNCDNAAGGTALLERLPVYSVPLSSRIRLPGNFTFFSCYRVAFRPDACIRLVYSTIEDNKPIMDNPVDLSVSASPGTSNSALALTPQSPMPSSKDQNLFVIYVNSQTHYIDGVVFLGKGTPEVHHYMSLVGMPQSLLNLLYRYEEGSKSGGLNLLEYLRLPKLQVIFYDRFAGFYKQLQHRMRKQEEATSLRERVIQEMTNNPCFTKEKREEYVKELTAQKSAFKREVQYELIKFLHESKDYMPQLFYLPDIRHHVQRRSDVLH